MSIVIKKQTTKSTLYSLIWPFLLFGLVGCSEPAKVTTTKQLSEDEIEICFEKPFKKGTLFSLDLLDSDGNHFNRSHYTNTFAAMYPNDTDSTCYTTRLFNYFVVGNSTPEEIRNLDFSLSKFESVKIEVATPKGMDNMSKNTPDEIIYNGTLVLNQ
ncbi:hypothetical protein R7P64_01970 [Vibrio sp. 2304]|uniref:hypothetical protein n=1 Tax=Vibrio TaxID=662 RepID=UPI002964A472|nr:hypothetical protein [Vibrio sp. 2304]MDW1999333.1 hypothetical protein [Vibrio sp. 2304]